MRRRPSVSTVIGLAVVLVASATLVVGTPQQALAQVSELQRQLDEARAERATTSRALRDARNRTDSARTRFAAAQREFDAAQAALREVDGQLDAAQTRLEAALERAALARVELDRVLADIDLAQGVFDERRARFESRVRAAFKYGNLSLTDVFSNVRDINDLMTTGTYVSAIVQNDRSLVDEMTELLEELSEARAQAVELRVRADQEREAAGLAEQEIARRLEEQRQITAEVNRTRTELAISLRALQADADALEEHLKALEASQQQIERQLRAAQAAERAGLAVGETGSGWLKPTNGWLSSGFGNRLHPILGTVRLHAGVDLAAPTGTPIVASRGGNVTFVGWMSGYGQTVMVYHGDGVATLYAHMSAFSVSQGSYVAQGGQLGAVGMTGTATGPHLHFEIRINGVPQNPCGYITC
jgi:murein DD-endopeptidase MepM/ murein hydrolase activator NlpD